MPVIPNVVTNYEAPMLIVITNLSLGSSIQFEMNIPEDISETPSPPSFSTYNILGRSSPPMSYNSGESRTLSFSLQLHRDLLSVPSSYFSSMSNNVGGSTYLGPNADRSLSEYFDNLLNQIKALNYPVYSGSGVVPPRVYCRIGNQVRIKGYCTTTVTYKRPIKYGKYMCADVNFDFTEVEDISWSASEIASGSSNYVYWG